MSGFCGCFQGDQASRGDGEALDRAARFLPGFLGSEVRQARHGRAQISQVQGADSLAGDGPVLAVLDGTPRWSDPALARRAAEIGHARTLAEAYRQKGAGLLEDLKGAFALAVVDTEAQEVLLAIDRFGIGTLCYAESPSGGAAGGPALGGLAFATSADAVRALAPEAASVSVQAIFDFFYFIDKIPAPFTIYQGIRKLPPGYCLHLTNGTVSPRPYWQMPYRAGGVADSGRTEEDCAEELLEKLRAAVGTCLTDADPARVGCFLSGGLDSSSVLGLLSELAPPPVRSFTIGFREDGYDESAYAALAAARFGSTHDTYILEPTDVLEALPRVAACYDEPFANSSCLPAYFCALRAKEAGVELLLAGDGGDELFAGNARYLKDRVFEPYGRLPRALRRGLIEPLFDGVPAIARVPLLRKLRNYAQLARLSVPERMHFDNLYRHFSPERVFSASLLEQINADSPLELAEEIFAAAPSASKVQKMMHLDLRVTLADSDLRKVGRMCELAGARVQFPFLDDDLVDFSAGIPPDLLMKDQVLRGFYKHALSGLLPQEILSKEKKGFGLPYIPLLASYAPLQRLARDSLESLGTRGWFNRSFLETMGKSLRSEEPANVSGFVWDLMVLEIWSQSHLDEGQTAGRVGGQAPEAVSATPAAAGAAS